MSPLIPRVRYEMPCLLVPAYSLTQMQNNINTSFFPEMFCFSKEVPKEKFTQAGYPLLILAGITWFITFEIAIPPEGWGRTLKEQNGCRDCVFSIPISKS